MKKLICIVAVTTLIACKTTQTAQMTGSDRDKHDCIPSAGYVWSAVRKDCIRTFEIGVPLYSLKKDITTSAAYIVFSSDSLHVETYIPERKNSVIMQYKNAGTWQGKGYTLRQTDEAKYTLYKHQQSIYSNNNCYERTHSTMGQ